MKTVLASAYAVNPYKGSEDGMGWNFILQVARYQRVIAITRKNNKGEITRYMLENPNPLYTRITFLYYDLPYYLRFWKKGGRGAMLYYWMWQRGLPSFIRQQNLEYDVVHNLNFHNDWTPSFLWKTGKPFVWGPVGHHPPIPGQYLEPYGRAARKNDRLKLGLKQFFRKYSPGLQQTMENADHIFCMNSSTRNALPVPAYRCSIMPSVGSEPVTTGHVSGNDRFQVLSVGRFIPLKGFDLTIRAFTSFFQRLPAAERANVSLTLVGDGPEKQRINQWIQESGIARHIRVIHWIKREELWQYYRQSSVFLFPSHEGAGMVVSEALSCGLPVVCLNNSGPGELISPDCGIAVAQKDYEQTVTALGNALHRVYRDQLLQERMSDAAVLHHQSCLAWNCKGEILRKIYEKVHGATEAEKLFPEMKQNQNREVVPKQENT